MQSYCRGCSKLENDNYYKSNKLKSNFNAKEYKEKRRQEIKHGLKCSKCGEDHPACLVFHHVNPTQKEYTIAYMINRSYSMNKIQKEKTKCIVLCANCHHKLHYG